MGESDGAGEGWLKCQNYSGIFSDEVIVRIATNKGQRHLFAWSSVIKQLPGVSAIRVQMLPSFRKNRYRRVILPNQTIEGEWRVLVPASDLLD